MDGVLGGSAVNEERKLSSSSGFGTYEREVAKVLRLVVVLHTTDQVSLVIRHETSVTHQAGLFRGIEVCRTAMLAKSVVSLTETSMRCAYTTNCISD